MWEALEQMSWVRTLSETGWMYATVSVIHYFSMFVLIGTVVILDLRVLGVAARRQTATQLAEQLSPWTWTFLVLALVSGFLEFSVIAGDYAQTWPFRVKMLVILVAIVSTIIVRRNVPHWDRLPVVPMGAKVLAAVSLVLWVGAILAGTEIALLTGLG
jgi:uncharacterized membrane protein YtjA (UPF0391 family)